MKVILTKYYILFRNFILNFYPTATLKNDSGTIDETANQFIYLNE